MEKKEIKDGKQKCSNCNYWLPVDQFFKNSSAATGLKCVCKACHKSKYDSKRKKVEYNSGVIGLFLNTCEYCHEKFTTKSSTKVFCSDGCRKRDWYERKLQTDSAKKYGTSMLYLNFKKGENNDL